MKKIISLALALLPLSVVSNPAQAQVAGEKIPNSYVCVFNKNMVSPGAVQGEAMRLTKALGGVLGFTYSASIRGFSTNMSAQAVEALKANNPSIAFCEQDQTVTSIPIRIEGKPSGGTTTVQPAQTTPWGILRVNGGAQGSFGRAWVIDTGIQSNHPDLRVDGALSRNFVSRERSWSDLNGHGTHVAGTIAALDNGIGVIGVAPGATLVAVRVLDKSGSGTTSGVIAGIDYVAQNGAPNDVANMSLGGGISQALDDAVVAAAAKGVKFALAAGNDSDNAMNHSPARANGLNVFTVSAFRSGDVFASFSNYGNPPVDFAEPGQSIYSTWIGSSYNTISGTSMATPHLAGLLLRGAVRVDGVVSGDPDGNADPIGAN